MSPNKFHPQVRANKSKMYFGRLSYSVCLALVSTVSAIGLHGAHNGLFQIHPSLSGDGITLYPGLHPRHDVKDLKHLVPDHARELYYTQEGHRPALHGAKHAHMNAVFTHPTIVLEHSNHIKSVQCYPHDEAMDICFKSKEAFDTVHNSWPKARSRDGEFNLVTHHVGCGDEMSGKRSFFRASDPIFSPETQCVVVFATPIEEHDALDSGEIKWGTYVSSTEHQKREPVLGHARVVHEATPITPPNGTYSNRTRYVDLSTNLLALRRFLNDSTISGVNMGEVYDTPLDVVDEDGEVEISNSTKALSSRGTNGRQTLSKRENFFVGLWNGIVKLVKGVISFFKGIVAVLNEIRKIVFELGVIGIKLILAAFGLPFKHSYHNDFKFKYRVEPSNHVDAAPNIFGITGGLSLNGVGGKSSLQCADCGIEFDFNLDGQLAFSIKNGITKGEVSMVNNGPMKFDAVFGFTVKDGNVEVEKNHQIAAFPVSPFTIPGIITLGPQISISVGVELEVEGTFELLIGGKYELSPGSALMDFVNKERSGVEGLKSKFTPVANFTGEVQITAALGLPIALEVGLDVLNGKFKKTVGLVDTPALFVSATYSKGQADSDCNNGVEIKVGVKNELALEAFEVWKKKIDERSLYERTLACVNAKGFHGEKDTPGIIDAVNRTMDTKQATKIPGIQNYAKKLKSSYGKQGFRLVMDAEEATILVSGTDGGLYLTDKGAKYDLSAPWGTVDMSANVLTYDTFGRILAYDHEAYHGQDGWAAPISVQNATKMPSSHRAMTLTLVKDKNGEKEGYVLTIVIPEVKTDYFTISEHQDILFPTACKTEEGMRIFATVYMLGKDGKVRNKRGNQVYRGQRWNQMAALENLGVVKPEENCKTPRLISTIKGLKQS